MKQYIEKLQIDFMCHSYLYYIKNTSVIPDSHFDQLCEYLNQYLKIYKNIKETKYYNLVKDLGNSGSGYYLKEEDYPDYITIIAYKLLRQKEENSEIQISDIKKELLIDRW